MLDQRTAGPSTSLRSGRDDNSFTVAGVLPFALMIVQFSLQVALEIVGEKAVEEVFAGLSARREPARAVGAGVQPTLH
jgi:hypothetical protein